VPPEHRLTTVNCRVTRSKGCAACPSVLPDFPDAVDLAILLPHAISRRIVGWRVSTSLRSDLALDALE
jgi:hypothetical protein